jgi:methyl-accepting chemotaxis protein
MTLLTEGWLEKYVKKLVGRTEMEDALKKLDKLTQEEARMAAAQNLKATHAVDERVKGVVDTVEAIDNKMVRANDLVAGVNDRVADVDNRVADVNDRVAVVNDRVAAVDDQVASVNVRVVTVDDRVKVVDSNLMQVIAGA